MTTGSKRRSRKAIVSLPVSERQPERNLDPALRGLISTLPGEQQPWWRPGQVDWRHPRPWLSPSATEFLESLLEPEMDVIEHGSGGSTLWMAQRCRTVSAFERNPKWFEQVKDHAPANVRLYPVGLPITPGEEMFDLLLIDGEPIEDRRAWIGACRDIVKPGGIIVLDNANRPDLEAARANLHKVGALLASIDGNEYNSHYMITDFFRLNGDRDASG